MYSKHFAKFQGVFSVFFPFDSKIIDLANVHLRLPNEVPPSAASVMELCWDKTPIDRPRFDDLIDLLERAKITEMERHGTKIQAHARRKMAKKEVAKKRKRKDNMSKAMQVRLGEARWQIREEKRRHLAAVAESSRFKAERSCVR